MAGKLEILLADDDSDDRELFANSLHRIAPGALLVQVNNGKQAIDYLTRCGSGHLPCAVLLDYNMPFMNAPQLLDWIRSRGWFDGIHKFVWSTADGKEYVDGCISKGSLAYFVKPTNETGIDTIIHRLLDACKKSIHGNQ